MTNIISRLVCAHRGHDWRPGEMYSDGWTATCHRCGKTREVDR